MRAILTRLRSNRGQSLVELSIIAPLLITLGFGVIEAGNIINSYLVLTHLTREAANLVSRETGIKGSTEWATKVNTDLSTVISNATPVINLSGVNPRGPEQFRVYYSMVEWDPSPGACPGGNIASGAADNYRIRRTNAGWTGTVTWDYGTLNQGSSVGAHGACAYLTLPQVKTLATSGLRLHIIEVFYDYTPSRLTPAHALIGALAPSIYSKRSVFMDVAG
jgi:Flp pilus assembly protein TadG